jgi:hypothetical protein
MVPIAPLKPREALALKSVKAGNDRRQPSKLLFGFQVSEIPKPVSVVGRSERDCVSACYLSANH